MNNTPKKHFEAPRTKAFIVGFCGGLGYLVAAASLIVLSPIWIPVGFIEGVITQQKT